MRLSKSCLGKEEIQAVSKILEIGYLGMGAEVQKFEMEISDFLSDETNVACVNTGTSALQLALQALGIGVGDEVLVPSLTFVASFQAVSATGATPVACDIDPNTGLLCLTDASKRVTSKTKALMYVLYASQSGDLDKVHEFATTYDLKVIEDAAHSFGCTYKNKKIGTISDVTCFSFDGIKNITSGEGGAVVSKDFELIERVRDLRLLGVEKDTERRFKRERSWDFDVKEQGWRYHMSEIMAAIGRVQLSKLEKNFAPKRRSFFEKYFAGLKEVEGISFLDGYEWENNHIIPHIMPIKVYGGLRDKMRSHLIDKEIEVGIHYKPNHLLGKFKTQYALPATEKFYNEILSLPLHPDLEDVDIENVIEEIQIFIKTEAS